MPIRYRKLGAYKYQLAEPYSVSVPFVGEAKVPFIVLHYEHDGTSILNIAKGYAWDGPSGPTIDTLNFMRGSLVHDALYQLIRMRKLRYGYRDAVDRLLQAHCIEDGMWRLRAWWVYQGVKWGGAGAAKPGTQKPIEYIVAPPEYRHGKQEKGNDEGREGSFRG